MRPNVILPNRTGAGDNETISCVNNIVIIGANGSGKSRIGSWIEFHQPDAISVHRISAQRALTIPNNVEMQTVNEAQSALFYGHKEVKLENKAQQRWQSNINTAMLTDYDKLLSLLFAKTVKRDADYVKLQKQHINKAIIPESPIDIIIRVWQDIMPQNSISFEDGKVLVARPGRAPYHGKDMSDGERVALYLLGQCLCAPDGSIVIIDEPEIHLHKSLMSRLWNKIEELCPEKGFVYITHDLDFATSRKEAHKFWIKKFNLDDSWEWENVPEVDELPENLVIEIVGNRRNIIFCEGDKGSYDYILYQAAFPDYYVIPRGGCEKVIESTKAFNGNVALHHLQAVGIIDADYRTQPEIAALQAAHIHTINVSEVENLFCIEPILRIVAKNREQDPDTQVALVTDFIITALKDEFDTQVTSHAEREIQFQLNTYTKTTNSEQGLQDGFDTLIAHINIPAIYTHSRALFQQAIDTNDLNLALRLYNRKNLANRLSGIFGLANGEYIKTVLRLLKGSEKANIVAALQTFMPVI